MMEWCTVYHECIKILPIFLWPNNKESRMPKTRKNRRQRPRFLYHPEDPSKSFDVYINKNPKDTIPIRYTTLQDVKDTIQRLESLYKQKKYPHKRIWQVGMILKVRLEVLKRIKPEEYRLAKRYLTFLSHRTTLKEDARYQATFLP